MSCSTASANCDKTSDPFERPQSVKHANEYEDAERNFQPKSLKFWTIIIGVYLAIFLVALVTLTT